MNDRLRATRAERLHPWFELQLRFAAMLASKTGGSLPVALTFYTNLHRRFGFGRPSEDRRSSEWDRFVGQLVALRTLGERVECTKAFARERLTAWHGADVPQFGCFSFDSPRDGVVRIHFAPNDMADGVGPLSRVKHAKRLKELTEMFEFILREHHADARYVAGGSWLYNLEAYRRLFPADYLESLQVHTKPSTMAGGSWWGQFVNHDENIVSDRARRFSESLPSLDPLEVWRVFPMPVMTASAPIAVFHEHYGVRSARVG